MRPTPRVFVIIFLAAVFLFPLSFSVCRVFASTQQAAVIFSQQANITYQCNDGIDNDGDGFIDFPADPDCTSLSDNNEGPHGVVIPPVITPPSGGIGGNEPAPSIVSLTPNNNAANVSASTHLVIVWSEPVTPHLGSIILRKLADNSIIETISVNGMKAVVSPNTVLTFTLSAALSQNTDYYVEMPRGLVVDAFGNNSPGITGSASWHFTTSALAAPEIQNVNVRVMPYSADVTWDTTIPTASNFSYGTTTDYRNGSGAESSYSLNHTVTLPNLAPGVAYFYKIRAAGVLGGAGIYTGTFVTSEQVDTTPPSNPMNFKAVAQKSSVALFWKNPPNPDLSSVRVMRSTIAYPMNPSDGTFLYEGVQELFIDMKVAVNVKYYYTIFARDTSGNYSSGAVASAAVVPPAQPPVIEVPPPVVVSPEVPTAPVQPPVVILPPTFSSFEYTEIGIGEKLLQSENDSVTITAGNQLKVSLPPEGATADTASLLLTVADPVSGESATYLFSRDQKPRPRHQTTISLGPPAQYPIEIKIFNSRGEIIADIRGLVRVITTPPPVSIILRTNISEPFRIIGPFVASFGLLAGMAKITFLVAKTISFQDVYFSFFAFLFFLFGIFRKKRLELHGVVYDSETKYPLSMVRLTLKRVDRKGQVMTLTDRNGKYRFSSKSGICILSAVKAGYIFPSTTLALAENDEAYSNLYTGAVFNVVQGQNVELNIPIDPIQSSWAEFLRNKESMEISYEQREKNRAWIWGTLFYIGFFVSAVNLAFAPSLVNGFIIVTYISITVFEWSWARRHIDTRLLNREGRPIPYAIISVITQSNTTLKKLVTDHLGRFYLKVLPGTYGFIIQEKQPDGSYLATYEMQNVPLEDGVFENDIMVTS